MEQDRTLGQHPSDNDPKEYIATPVVLKVLIAQVPEWFKGADCKSVVRGFKSHPVLKG